MLKSGQRREYWTTNLRYVATLLSIWFILSYGLGILLAGPLDRIRIGGFQLGFWLSRQGSIFFFVVLIFVYLWLMNRLDKRLELAQRDDETI